MSSLEEKLVEAARRMREADMKARELYTPAEQNLKWNYDPAGRVQNPRLELDGPYRGPVDAEGFPVPVKTPTSGALPQEPVPEIAGPPNPPMPAGVAHQERHDLDERLREVSSKIKEENGKRYLFKTREQISATVIPANQTTPPIGGPQSEQPLNPVDVVSQTPQSSAEPTDTTTNTTTTGQTGTQTSNNSVQSGLEQQGFSKFGLGQDATTGNFTVGFTYGGLNYGYNIPDSKTMDPTDAYTTGLNDISTDLSQIGIQGILRNSAVGNISPASEYAAEFPTAYTGPMTGEVDANGDIVVGPNTVTGPTTTGGAGPTSIAPGDIATYTTQIGTTMVNGVPVGVFQTTTVTNNSEEKVIVNPYTGVPLSDTVPAGFTSTTSPAYNGEPGSSGTPTFTGSPTGTEETPAGFTDVPAVPLPSDTVITGPTDISPAQQAEIGQAYGDPVSAADVQAASLQAAIANANAADAAAAAKNSYAAVGPISTGGESNLGTTNAPSPQGEPTGAQAAAVGAAVGGKGSSAGGSKSSGGAKAGGSTAKGGQRG
jgi:hypothetical protein